MVPIRLSGGASKVSIHRPTGVEARMSVKGGASKLTFDEQSFDALGGKVRLQSPVHDGATDRLRDRDLRRRQRDYNPVS